MKTLFFQLCYREWLRLYRQPRKLVYSLLFFILVLLFVPLSLRSEQNLAQMTPTLVWLAFLFALLLAGEYLFQQDFKSGVLEQYLLTLPSFALFIFVKLLMQWLLLLLPILLFCPLLTLFYHLSPAIVLVLMLSLVIGSPIILGLSAFAEALSLSLDQKGSLAGFIVFTLALPLLMLGAGTVTAFELGIGFESHLAILTAFSLVVLAFLPWLLSYIIRLILSS